MLSSTSGNGRWWAFALLAAAAVGFPGCGGSGDDPSPGPPSRGEPDLGEVVDNPSGDDIVLPLDAYLPHGHGATSLELARSILTSECVTGEGYAYPVLPRPEWASPNVRRYGLVDAAQAARRGYTNPPNDERTQALFEANAADLPQNVFLGCLALARQQLESLEVESEDADFVYELSNDSWKDAQADSRVQDAFDDWAACMDDVGYPSAGAPFDFSNAWADHRAAEPPPDAGDSGGGGGGGDAAAIAPAEGEIAAATADVRCKEEANVAGIWWAVEIAYQHRGIEEHGARLRGIAERLDVAIDRSTDVLAAHDDPVAG